MRRVWNGKWFFVRNGKRDFFGLKEPFPSQNGNFFFPFRSLDIIKYYFILKLPKPSQAEACVCCALLTVFQLFTAFILTMLKTSFVIFRTGQLNTSLKSQQCLIFINKA